MSWRAYEAVVESNARFVSPTGRSLMSTLALMADRLTGVAWPSVAVMCRHTGASRATIFRHLSWLERRGFIQRAGGVAGRRGGKPVTRWRIGLRALAEADGRPIRNAPARFGWERAKEAAAERLVRLQAFTNALADRIGWTAVMELGEAEIERRFDQKANAPPALL